MLSGQKVEWGNWGNFQMWSFESQMSEGSEPYMQNQLVWKCSDKLKDLKSG